MLQIRPPAVAGTFYPRQREAVGEDISTLLAAAQTRIPSTAQIPKAIIVPHAGYIYSGPIAASAYARLIPARATIKRVVLLGPVHRVPVRGLALPGVDFFATPLGNVPVDQAAVALLAHMPQVVESHSAHAQEHSLEVQLPFLQRILADFSLVPLAVGDATPEEVAQVLERLWGGPETLIVISSDLSHFLPYDLAQRADGDTAEQILDLRESLSHEQACGGTPVNGLLLAAKRHHLEPQLLDLRNSGDTAGDKDRVVGYASFAFMQEPQIDTNSDRGQVLLPIARAAIAQALGKNQSAREDAVWLQEIGACFVTLTQAGALRGCIGTLEAYRPLLADVKANAVAAALHDSRFAPLREEELASTRVEISLLSPLQAMRFANESDAVSQLRPMIDGVVFEYGEHRSTFLPQVWEQLPEPENFLMHLKRKAGLATDFWADDVKLSRYTVSKWQEPSEEAHLT